MILTNRTLNVIVLVMALGIFLSRISQTFSSRPQMTSRICRDMKLKSLDSFETRYRFRRISMEFINCDSLSMLNRRESIVQKKL